MAGRPNIQLKISSSIICMTNNHLYVRSNYLYAQISLTDGNNAKTNVTKMDTSVSLIWT